MDYPVWVWRPDLDMIESLEWMTDIIEAYDGEEQRIQVRQEPRQSFEASVFLKDILQMSKIRVLLASWQNRMWAWPNWHEAVSISAPADAGAGLVYGDWRYGDWRYGENALIYESPTKYQVLDITEITESVLSFSNALISTYAAGSWVLPLRRARISNQIDRQDYIGNDLAYSLSVQVVDNSELSTTASEMQYLGYDVLLEPLGTFSSSIKRQMSYPLDIIDPGMGAWASFSRSNFSKMLTPWEWVLKTPEKCWEFRKWLHRRAGALRPVWMPSYVDDLKLAAMPVSSSTTLKIADVGYRTFGLNVPGMSHIAVFSSSGVVAYRKINAAVAGVAGQENLTLNASLGFSDVVRISFLSLCRFSGDLIKLKWKGVGDARCESSMVTTIL